MKYGWPFLLFIGVPFVATMSGSVAAFAYSTFGSGEAGSYGFALLWQGLFALTTALLLGALYLRVRQLENATLRLVWGCTLVLSVISAALHLGALSLDYVDSYVRGAGLSALVSLFGLAVLVWFARRASRLSLPHAFFLAFVIGGVTLPYLPESTPILVEQALSVGVRILAVWLLANFDERGPSFRKRSAVVVVALDGFAYLPALLLGVSVAALDTSAVLVAALVLTGLLVSFILPLVLIYLLRVRQPEGGVRVQ